MELIGRQASSYVGKFMKPWDLNYEMLFNHGYINMKSSYL